MNEFEKVTSDLSLSLEERYVYSVLTTLSHIETGDVIHIDGDEVTRQSFADGLGLKLDRFLQILSSLQEEGLVEVIDDYPDSEMYFWTDQMGGPGHRFQPDGWVYIAYADTGHYKVGRSVDPSSRVDHFDVQMPVEVDILYQIPCDDYKSAESELHDLLSDCQVTGEWFDLPQHTIRVLGDIIRFKDGEFRVANEYTYRKAASLSQDEILSLRAAGPQNNGLDMRRRIVHSLDC
jgi:hypothetical protein